MPEVNGKEPSQKVKSLLANWDVKKHQPYATHKAFVKISKEIANKSGSIASPKMIANNISNKFDEKLKVLQKDKF